jgi:hypothetical protein
MSNGSRRSDKENAKKTISRLNDHEGLGRYDAIAIVSPAQGKSRQHVEISRGVTDKLSTHSWLLPAENIRTRTMK